MDSPLPMYVCDFNSFPPTHSHSGLCGSVALQPTSCRENHLLTPLICRGKHHPMQLKLEGGNSFFSQLGSNCDQTIQWSCDWHLQRCLVCLCLVESHFSGNTHTYAKSKVSAPHFLIQCFTFYTSAYVLFQLWCVTLWGLKHGDSRGKTALCILETIMPPAVCVHFLVARWDLPHTLVCTGLAHLSLVRGE